jgi:hypothetical protein
LENLELYTRNKITRTTIPKALGKENKKPVKNSETELKKPGPFP